MKAVWRPLLAEYIGTAMLLCAVIGSGIMGERLAGGNDAIALLANTLVTVFALYVLIETLGPVSGAHFNPLVSMVLGQRGRHLLTTITAQLLGAVSGALDLTLVDLTRLVLHRLSPVNVASRPSGPLAMAA